MAHAASQLKKNRDLEINAEEETEKKRKHRKRSRDRKKKVAMCVCQSIDLAWLYFVLISSWHLLEALRAFFFFKCCVECKLGVQIGNR